MARKWINQTPVGRLGFPNYGALRKFCERHGIEIPTRKKRSWQQGAEVEHYDYALLEKKRGVEIKHLLYQEQTANIPIAAIANLFGVRPELVKDKIREFLVKIGGRLFVPKGKVVPAVNRVRDELEAVYIHLATKSVSRDYGGW